MMQDCFDPYPLDHDLGIFQFHVYDEIDQGLDFFRFLIESGHGIFHTHQVVKTLKHALGMKSAYVLVFPVRAGSDAV